MMKPKTRSVMRCERIKSSDWGHPSVSWAVTNTQDLQEKSHSDLECRNEIKVNRYVSVVRGEGFTWTKLHGVR